MERFNRDKIKKRYGGRERGFGDRKGSGDRRGSRGPNRRGGDRRGPRGSDRRGGSRERPQMHRVVCSKCGCKCEVPFKPTDTKPVYCDYCFQKNKDSSSGSMDLTEINDKLDEILSILRHM